MADNQKADMTLPPFKSSQTKHTKLTKRFNQLRPNQTKSRLSDPTFKRLVDVSLKVGEI